MGKEEITHSGGKTHMHNFVLKDKWWEEQNHRPREEGSLGVRGLKKCEI